MVRTKSFLEKFYVGLIFFLLYAPIAVLIVCSFNASKARTVWGGFTLDWYIQLFQNEEVIHAVQTSLLLTTSAALIATILGTLACIGMTVMSKRAQSVITTITNIPMLNADIVTGIAIMLLFVRFMSLGYASMLIGHVPGIFSGFLMAFTISLDDFIITYFTKGAGINTISTMLYQEVRRGINPEMYAMSTLLFLAILLILFVVNRISAKQEEA